MKPFLTIVAIIIVLGLLTAVARSVKPGSPTPSPSLSTLLQVCPNEKIDNRMPGPGGAKPSYYILNGERKEISDFDGAWVAANCNVSTQVVY